MQKAIEVIEDQDYSCGIFLDFSKETDTVNHSILLKKLEYSGIRGVVKDWFNSYLSNRNQIESLGMFVQTLKQYIMVGLEDQYIRTWATSVPYLYKWFSSLLEAIQGRIQEFLVGGGGGGGGVQTLLDILELFYRK